LVREREQPPGRGPAGERSRSGLIAAAVLALVVLAIVLTVVLGNGSSNHASSSNANSKQARSGASHRSHKTKSSAGSAARSTPAQSTASSGAASTTSGAAAPSTGSAAPTTSAASAASTPTSAVESFYKLAAAHRYADAWALADPTFQNQLGGYSAFQSGQAGDRSITFDSARVTNMSANSASVSIRTTSVRDSGTQHCSGSVDLVRGSSSAWLLHLIHISCV
jgi:hypothetical protein